MSVRCTRPPTVRFTQVRNEWARDRRISFKARGLLLYLSSHADGYECSTAQIIRDTCEGKDAVRSGLAELETAGYLHRERARAEDGRWGEVDYVLADPFAPAALLAVSPPERETRHPAAGDQRETRQSGLSAAGNPPRETRPLEDQRENTKQPPTPLPLGDAEEPRPTTAELFDQWWAAYPKKVGKDAARRAWGKAVKRADADKIIEVTRGYPFREDRQYVKDPATWLNAGCWEDDLAAVAAARDGAGNGYGRRSSPPYQNPPEGAYRTGRTSF